MSNRLFTPLGITSSFGGMLLIGALEALYGPSLIRLIERFETSPSAAGIIVSAHFIGGLLGVLASQMSMHGSATESRSRPAIYSYSWAAWVSLGRRP